MLSLSNSEHTPADALTRLHRRVTTGLALPRLLSSKRRYPGPKAGKEPTAVHRAQPPQGSGLCGPWLRMDLDLNSSLFGTSLGRHFNPDPGGFPMQC